MVPATVFPVIGRPKVAVHRKRVEIQSGRVVGVEPQGISEIILKQNHVVYFLCSCCHAGHGDEHAYRNYCLFHNYFSQVFHEGFFVL